MFLINKVLFIIIKVTPYNTLLQNSESWLYLQSQKKLKKPNQK